MSAAIARSVTPHEDMMASLRASFLESIGVVVERAEKPVIVYMDHQVSSHGFLAKESVPLTLANRWKADAC